LDDVDGKDEGLRVASVVQMSTPLRGVAVERASHFGNNEAFGGADIEEIV
jgi:hypothetical protein